MILVILNLALQVIPPKPPLLGHLCDGASGSQSAQSTAAMAGPQHRVTVAECSQWATLAALLSRGLRKTISQQSKRIFQVPNCHMQIYRENNLHSHKGPRTNLSVSVGGSESIHLLYFFWKVAN